MTVDSKVQENNLSVWQMIAVHIVAPFETLDSALRHTNPLNLRDKITQVYK